MKEVCCQWGGCNGNGKPGTPCPRCRTPLPSPVPSASWAAAHIEALRKEERLHPDELRFLMEHGADHPPSIIPVIIVDDTPDTERSPMNNPSHVNEVGPFPKKKEFRKVHVGGPYGPRIAISAGVPLLAGHEETLNQLSLWGGNTSNSPEKYSLWEFKQDGFTFLAAVHFLLASGFREEGS